MITVIESSIIIRKIHLRTANDITSTGMKMALPATS